MEVLTRIVLTDDLHLFFWAENGFQLYLESETGFPYIWKQEWVNCLIYEKQHRVIYL